MAFWYLTVVGREERKGGEGKGEPPGFGIREGEFSHLQDPELGVCV
jgi:hypothetical protein